MTNKILKQDLINIGFKFGTYAGSMSVNSITVIGYRNPGLGAVGDECELDGFHICNYGESSCVSSPIKIKSIEDIITLSKFF